MIFIVSSTFRVGNHYKHDNFPQEEWPNIRVITSREQLWSITPFEYIIVCDDLPIKNKVLVQLDYLRKIGIAKEYHGTRSIEA